jgi:hypothetical protein
MAEQGQDFDKKWQNKGKILIRNDKTEHGKTGARFL